MLPEKIKNLFLFIKDKIWHPMQLRIMIVGAFFAVLFFILVNKLYDLQIVNGQAYSERFIDSIERTVKTPGTRGNIYDVNGNLLAYNRLSYNVVVADDGSYTDYNDRNLMLYRLTAILQKHGAVITSRFEVNMDENGEYYFTSSSDSSRRRFIANVYGCSTDQLDRADEDTGVVRYPSDISAQEAVNIKIGDYAFDSIKNPDGTPVIPDEITLLNMVKILFTMRQTAFQRYETSTIATDIGEECMAEIMENQGDLKGVSVEESYIRRYNNAKYFSHIIGYTGAIRDDATLKELQKSNPDYEMTDQVGATGLEKSMEQELHGIKGERRIYVDSYGQVLEVISETEPSAGNDIYLSIDQNLQIGIYHLLEQQLAGILANKIVNVPLYEMEEAAESSDVQISVDDAFFQFINNNILDVDSFFDEADRGPAEAEIAEAFTRHKAEVINTISSQLSDTDAVPLSGLPKEYIAYMAYIMDALSQGENRIVDQSAIDIYSESYLAWKNDSISLRGYLYSGIAEGWVSVDSLLKDDTEKYQDADVIYQSICDYIIEQLSDDRDFDKLIYRYMLIENNGISGRLLSMALYEQGVLPYDEAAYNALSAGDENYAYSFLIDRIKAIDITPAQLALDPCMGSVVVTDVNTGDVKALVTYPGYDNNRINDSEYFNECLNDLSLPLINSATQTNKAPGSTLKPLMAIAALEEGVMTTEETVDCTGVYTEASPPIRCWIGRPGHHELTVEGAIENSCNYSFAEYGHRFSMVTDESTGEQVYSASTGIGIIQKYESMFGLDRVSGIQIDENEPHMSDSDPERSAFGQGTNSFNNVQLARYTTALANRGKLFDLTLLSKETDCNGNLIQEFPAELIDTIEISDSTWDTVHSGTRKVITTGVASSVFNNWDTVEIAGKTGTAEEVKTRGNHGEFISYAPYDNPEVAVTVVLPFAYSSGNAATLGRRVYDYYYGEVDLPSIINNDARNITLSNVTDG